MPGTWHDGPAPPQSRRPNAICERASMIRRECSAPGRYRYRSRTTIASSGHGRVDQPRTLARVQVPDPRKAVVPLRHDEPAIGRRALGARSVLRAAPRIAGAVARIAEAVHEQPRVVTRQKPLHACSRARAGPRLALCLVCTRGNAVPAARPVGRHRNGPRNVGVEPEALHEGAGKYDVGRAPRVRLRTSTATAVRIPENKEAPRAGRPLTYFAVRFDTDCLAGVSFCRPGHYEFRSWWFAATAPRPGNALDP